VLVVVLIGEAIEFGLVHAAIGGYRFTLKRSNFCQAEAAFVAGGSNNTIGPNA
jgi:hypothetical protein